MISKTLNVSFSLLEITLTLLSSFIKFKNPRKISGSERIKVGSSRLCWHNFRIIGTDFGSISIENYASIIGSSL